MWCLYTQWNIIYPLKMIKILPFSTTWIDLEDIMLSEISHTEKDKYHMISLICGILKQTQRPRAHGYTE